MMTSETEKTTTKGKPDTRSYNFCFKWKAPQVLSMNFFGMEQLEMLIESTKAFNKRSFFTQNQFEDPDLWIISFKSRRSIKKVQELLKKYCDDVMPDFIDLRVKHGNYCKPSFHLEILKKIFEHKVEAPVEKKMIIGSIGSLKEEENIKFN